ncbi:hypothetical protein PHYBOEH_009358 [Phytophthora boehmeriae]|uniref:RxLR effector protein n=1 Tax=Phytophthora boehmeriae TaxID=109152 RepID=A0A8T1VT75_9STRA|nr:hypothetical protein PHYBOEH_009358 [Phytophthora boehmeriae]
MRPFQVLLLITFAFFACHHTLATATEIIPSKSSALTSPDSTVLDLRPHAGRFLRIANAAEAGNDAEDDPELDSTDTEERGILSSIQSKISSMKEKFSMSRKWRKWANTGQSDDAVKKELGLEGLSGTALTTHKNYKYYQKFAYKAEGLKLNGWVYDDISTYDVWKMLGLEKMIEKGVNFKNTPEYRTYQRYVRKYDDSNAIAPERHTLKFTGSDQEKMAKTDVWIAENRPKWFVKKMLGLKGMQKKQRVNDPDYKYYERYLQATGQH